MLDDVDPFISRSHPMPSFPDASIYLKESLRCGDYRGGRQFIHDLAPAVRREPRLALKCARFLLRQGYLLEARAILADADLASAPSDLADVVRFEDMATALLGEADMNAAAKTALNFLRSSLPPSSENPDHADAVAIAARIVSTCFVYYEADSQAAAFARDSMAKAASALEVAGRVDEAFNAHHNHANWPRGAPSCQIDALRAVAARAQRYPKDRAPVIAAAQALLAVAQLELNAPQDEFETTLESARSICRADRNESGLLDIERLELLREARGGAADESALVALVEKFLDADLPREALSHLLDVSQRAHVRGATKLAHDLRLEIAELSERIGMTLTRASSEVALADILTRARKLTDAADVCLAILSRPGPRIVHAQARQILSSVHSFSGATEKAIAASEAAREEFIALGADDHVSIATSGLANQLMSLRTEDAFARAIWLTDSLIDRNIALDDVEEAIRSITLSAQGRWQYFNFLQNRGAPNNALLSEAQQLLARADALAVRLPTNDAAKARGGISQLRGMVESSLGIPGQPEAGYRAAIDHYGAAGFAMEAANSRYIVGVVRLNAAVECLRVGDIPALSSNSDESARQFEAALAYYTEASMRSEAANARKMLAILCKNARIVADGAGSTRLREAALGYLTDAFADLDAVRREFAASDRRDAQAGKQDFAAQTNELVELAFDLLAFIPGAEAHAWRWAQNGKSRALADLLGLAVAPPQSLVAPLRQHERRAALLDEAQRIGASLRTAPPGGRPPLRARLAELEATMAQDGAFADYLAFIKGAPIGLDSLPLIFDDRPGACVDWVKFNGRLALMIARPQAAPQILPLDLDVQAVEAFIDAYLRPGPSARATLARQPELLRQMDGLIAPLADATRPDELLLLCPTDRLHALPLHALTIEGRPLIARNPVAYSYGFGITRHAIVRRGEPAPPRHFAVFGDPAGPQPRPVARQMAEKLGLQMGTPACVGEEATKAAFVQALKLARNVHFQGHAFYDMSNPLGSGLKLANTEVLTAAELLDAVTIAAEQVTLGACEAAANQIRTGDEPIGLIPSMQIAGAHSVVAALWPVQDKSCAAFMSAYYARLSGAHPMAKVDALRESVLEITQRNEFSAPYHWAAYVLHGDWL